ncbi:MAG: tetratricopeptide repeat protein [Candidatus Methylacidiphilales bacterium]
MSFLFDSLPLMGGGLFDPRMDNTWTNLVFIILLILLLLYATWRGLKTSATLRLTVKESRERYAELADDNDAEQYIKNTLEEDVRVKALKAEGASMELILAHQRRLIEKDLKEAIWLTGNNPVALAFAYMCHGSSLFYLGDIDESVVSLEKSIKLNPLSDECWRLLISGRWAQSDYDGALEAANFILQYSSGEEEGYHFPADSPEDTERNSTYITDVRVWKAEILVFRSMLWRSKGDTNATLADLDQVVEMKPEATDTLLIRGDTRRILGDSYGALADYAAVSAIEDDLCADAQLKSALVLRQAGNFPAALAAFDACLTQSPEDAVALLFRARTRLVFGDLQGAEADFVAAAALDAELTTRFRSVQGEN